MIERGWEIELIECRIRVTKLVAIREVPIRTWSLRNNGSFLLEVVF